MRGSGSAPAPARVQIRAGQHATFPAEVVWVSGSTAANLGLTDAEGAAELRSISAYLAVDPRQLLLR